MEQKRKRAIILFLIAISYWIIASVIKFFPSQVLLVLAFLSIIFSALLFSSSIKLLKHKDYVFGISFVLLSSLLILTGIISVVLEFLIGFL